MNSHSHALTKEEACLIREDWKRAVRFVKSYRYVPFIFWLTELQDDSQLLRHGATG